MFTQLQQNETKGKSERSLRIIQFKLKQRKEQFSHCIKSWFEYCLEAKASLKPYKVLIEVIHTINNDLMPLIYFR